MIGHPCCWLLICHFLLFCIDQFCTQSYAGLLRIPSRISCADEGSLHRQGGRSTPRDAAENKIQSKVEGVVLIEKFYFATLAINKPTVPPPTLGRGSVAPGSKCKQLRNTIPAGRGRCATASLLKNNRQLARKQKASPP